MCLQATWRSLHKQFGTLFVVIATIHTAPKLDTYQMEATLLCDGWLDASINLAYRLGKLTLILFVRAERAGI